MTFEKWVAELKLIFFLMGWEKEAIDTIDTESHREKYNDGVTPAEAIQEEMSYA